MPTPIYAIEFPIYQRAMRIIDNITNANKAVVTTTFKHQYLDGLIIRFVIPSGYGMEEINKKQSVIRVLSDTTFEVDINTISFSTYSVPAQFPDNKQQAQVIPTGEINSSLLNATQNVLPYTS